MKFKITKVTVDSVSVDYDDGSYAIVPITKNMSLDNIKDSIAGYNNPPSPFAKVGDVPLTVGQEIEFVRSEEDDMLTYAQARAANYPSVGSQLDALYWERQGDDTQRKLYDVTVSYTHLTLPTILLV